MASADTPVPGTTPSSGAAPTQRRGAFSSRTVFIMAAIGSAVGLGNIWRFPYVAYENGGGAFLIPYLFALFFVGMPFLFLDYAMGHRFRGASPLTWARMKRWTEAMGWWHVAICIVIGLYYAAILAWAARYTVFSVDKAWGDDPEGFFYDFLNVGEPGIDLTFVAGVLVPMILVWLVVIAIMVAGVDKGVGRLSAIGIPVLVLAFLALVVQALMLPGALDGVAAFFTPDWSVLTHPGVWGAAFGQIFFSLSVGFGIMITYASYVDRDTDLVGSGTVVGLANSSFELLAGIGVFAALGFMAQAQGKGIDDVASGGVGLAFVTFPTIISEAPGGALLGVLFFGSLVIAGITSMVSILEVIISAIRDKFDMHRVTASLVVSLPMAAVSVAIFGTASGLHVLDIVDYFINQFGILLAALVAVVLVGWVLRLLPFFGSHLDRHSSLRISGWWKWIVGILVPVAVGYILIQALMAVLDEGYGGYPEWMISTFGWGVVLGSLALAAILTLLPWSSRTSLEAPDASADPATTGTETTDEGALR